MRIGFRLLLGFGFMLVLLCVLVILGWEGQRRLTEAQSILVRRSTLEADIRTMQAGALALMMDPKPDALDAVLSRSGMLDQSFAAFKMHVEHDMGVRIDKAMRANIEFRGAVERWQTVADARAARVTETENIALTFATLFDELAGKTRDAAFAHSDGYASADQVNTRLAELRRVNDIQRDFYEARLLARDWLKSGDPHFVDDIRTRMGAVMAALNEIKNGMSGVADKDMADTLLAHGRDYLAALSDLEDSTASLKDVRSTLATAVTDMHEPMTLLADKYQAAVDYVKDIAVLAVGGVLALGLFVSLLFTFMISSGVRKRLDKIRLALDSLGAGECPTRDNGDLPSDMGKLVDSIQRVAMGEIDLAERVQMLAKGDVSITISPRSEKDSLGVALMQLAEGERAVLDALISGAAGDFRTSITPRSNVDEIVRAITAQQKFVSGKMHAIRHASGQLRDLAGKAMESLKMLEQRIAAESGSRGVRNTEPMPDLLPRFEAVCSTMKLSSKAVETAVQQADRLREALLRLDGSFKSLMSKATFSEDVARQVETLAINMNIEMARSGESSAGVQAIVSEMRSVVERCRDNAGSINELLYSGRRASDDVAVISSGVVEALDMAAQASVSDMSKLEAEITAMLEFSKQTRTTGKSLENDAEFQKIAAGLGKAFSGIVMELNTLRSLLDTFSIGTVSESTPHTGGAQETSQKAVSKSVPDVKGAIQVRSMPPLRLGKASTDIENIEGDDSF